MNTIRKSVLAKQRAGRQRFCEKRAKHRKPCGWMPFVAPNGQHARYDHRGMVMRNTGLVIREWKVPGVSFK